MRELDYTRQAERFIEKLLEKNPKIARDIAEVISDLRVNPTLGRKLTNYPDYRAKTSNYRIIYNFTDSELEILMIEHRKDIYKKYKRRRK